MLVLRIASGELVLENLKRYLFSIVLLKVTKISTWPSQQPWAGSILALTSQEPTVP